MAMETRRAIGGKLVAGVLAWSLFLGFTLTHGGVEHGAAKLLQEAADQGADGIGAHFGYCPASGGDCVVDGDTFRLEGRTYRIADIDTPETHEPRCAPEAALGVQATRRLQALMNAGSFMLEPIDRERDRYGRTLRVVTRAGRSVGERLVAEGLARRWDGARRPWCRRDGRGLVRV